MIRIVECTLTWRQASRQQAIGGKLARSVQTSGETIDGKSCLLLNILNLSLSLSPYTCPPNRNDVFRIGQRVRPIFLNSGHLIGSGDMCPQIKSIYFLVL